MIGMSRQLGSALGIAILVAILGSHTDTVGAFRDGWSYIVGAALAAALVLLAVGPVQVAAAAQPANEPEPAPIRAATDVLAA
jgi:hypothetical protein